MEAAFMNETSDSDLILIDNKIDTSEPWQAWAEQVIEAGFAIVSISPSMQEDFEVLQRLAGAIRFKDKQEFSFVERTDGYFPVGYSYLKKENTVSIRSAPSGVLTWNDENKCPLMNRWTLNLERDLAYR